VSEVFVCRRQDLADDTRQLIDIDGIEVAVLLAGDTVVAYENRCLHQGGPVCEGLIIGRVEALIDDHKRSLGETFSASTLHIACPWHGWEYDLATGECASDRRRRLRKFEVTERAGDVYLRIGAPA
jgi:nitrite reductase/ring-hydroxylating ferredoxin subunit